MRVVPFTSGTQAFVHVPGIFNWSLSPIMCQVALSVPAWRQAETTTQLPCRSSARPFLQGTQARATTELWPHPVLPRGATIGPPRPRPPVVRHRSSMSCRATIEPTRGRILGTPIGGGRHARRQRRTGHRAARRSLAPQADGQAPRTLAARTTRERRSSRFSPSRPGLAFQSGTKPHRWSSLFRTSLEPRNCHPSGPRHLIHPDKTLSSGVKHTSE